MRKLLIAPVVLSQLALAAPTGIGTTVAGCNGTATMRTTDPGKPPVVETAPAVLIWGRDAVVGLAHTIFAYSGLDQIRRRTLPLAGKRGQYQFRLALTADAMPAPPKIGESYEGIFLISEWNETNRNWASLGGTRANVTITRYDLNEAAWNSTDKMCAGIVEGKFAMDGTGGAKLEYQFAAPLLTKNFPQ